MAARSSAATLATLILASPTPASSTISAGGPSTTDDDGLFMAGPDSNTSADLLITGSTAGFNLMQGSLGTLFFSVNSHGASYGVAGEATINGGNAGDFIFDTGGVTADNLSLASTGGADAIFYAQFSLT